MSDAELARMLQEQENSGGAEDETAGFGTEMSSFGGGGGGGGAADEDDDEAFARRLQEEEDAATEAPRSKSKDRSKSKEDVVLPESAYESVLSTRHDVKQLGWKKVYVRLHGSMFTVYSSEKSKTSVAETDVVGAKLSEAEASGKFISKKDISRFTVTASDGTAHDYATEDEHSRALWLGHLIVAGATHPPPQVCLLVARFIRLTTTSNCPPIGFAYCFDFVLPEWVNFPTTACADAVQGHATRLGGAS